MKEEFLHYLWKYKLLGSPLVGTYGETIEVIKPGAHNTDAGPDFIDARIRIDGTTWAGNVEMHLHSSAWNAHHHDQDLAYNNVILHVVLHKDAPVFRSNGQEIPCLECSGLIPPALYEKYKGLMSSKLWVPCARIVKYCSTLTIRSCIESQLVERQNRKAETIEQSLQNLNYDWEETFYRLVARSFGLQLNSFPFEMLASSISYKTLIRHNNMPLQVEALLFGQAGMLECDFADPYPLALKNEYVFLKKKYSLSPLNASVWKFLRLRPAAFPSIRISQFADLIQRSGALFAEILETTSIEKLRDLFLVRASEYWNNHYRFDVPAKENRPKVIGDDSINLILINAIVPMLFMYGRMHRMDEITGRALLFLEELPAESNTVIRKWKSSGIEVNDAFTSQALLHLKQVYCDHKKCLDCRIGGELLR